MFVNYLLLNLVEDAVRSVKVYVRVQRPGRSFYVFNLLFFSLLWRKLSEMIHYVFFLTLVVGCIVIVFGI